MDFVKSMEERRKPRDKIKKKKWNEAIEKEKMKCRKECERKTKTKPAQLQEKKERKRSEK